eukprot:Pompholyxophrys_punicea_v1_NODE_618_length_1587_cov_7.462794.p1 type:complete len:217 gc:universal NODE_618_length_1587_cov_7.462794:1235-585(-)
MSISARHLRHPTRQHTISDTFHSLHKRHSQFNKALRAIHLDDNSLITTATTLQHDINSITEQFLANNLIPSPTKTTITIFNPTKQTHTCHLTQAITVTDSTKILGLHIRNNLKYHNRIHYLINKLKPALHTLRHVSPVLPIQARRQHILSHSISFIKRQSGLFLKSHHAHIPSRSTPDSACSTSTTYTHTTQPSQHTSSYTPHPPQLLHICSQTSK